MSNSTIALQSAGQVTTVAIGDITYHFAITQLIAVTVAEQLHHPQITAIRRNDWGTLLHGQFEEVRKNISGYTVLKRKEFAKLVELLTGATPLSPGAVSEWLNKTADLQTVA